LDQVKKIGDNYAFRLKIAEVLRGKPEEVGKEVPIDHCGIGYGDQWEGGEMANGMRVIAFLCRREDRTWELMRSCEVIKVLGMPGDPEQPRARRRIEGLKKNLALLDIADPKNRLDAVRRGLRDPLSEHQQFCVWVLECLACRPKGDTAFYIGVDLSGVISREMALSLVWEVYTAADTPLDTVICCDRVFSGARLDHEFCWRQYAPRYRILRDAIKRHVASGSRINHNQFDYAIRDLCAYPEHARESYEIMRDVIRRNFMAYEFGTTINLERAYTPHTEDPELKRLDGEVWAKLIGMLADMEFADGAAIGIGNLAVRFARMGDVPDGILSVVDGRTKPQGMRDVAYRLAPALDEVRAARRAFNFKTPPGGAEGAEILTPPWERYLGKKVLVSGRPFFGMDKDGGIQVDTQLLWLGPHAQWPDSVRPKPPVIDVAGNLTWPNRVSGVLVVGKLTATYDLPVFRYKRGEPFGKGLPVPEGFSLHDASRRFVLVDVSWRVAESDPP
jgi:hypothetical protein